jgi:hypothetical protein
MKGTMGVMIVVTHDLVARGIKAMAGVQGTTVRVMVWRWTIGNG